MPNPDLRGSQSQPLGRPFVIRRHHIPRRLLCRSLLNHFLVGFHVITPEVALGGVIEENFQFFIIFHDKIADDAFCDRQKNVDRNVAFDSTGIHKLADRGQDSLIDIVLRFACGLKSTFR